MAARLKIRDSYATDAAFMLKLADAIERDGEINDGEVVRTTLGMLHALSAQLLRLKGPMAINSETRPDLVPDLKMKGTVRG